MFRHPQPDIPFLIEADIPAVKTQYLRMNFRRKRYIDRIQVGNEPDARSALLIRGQRGRHNGMFIHMDMRKPHTLQFPGQHAGQLELARGAGHLTSRSVTLGIYSDITHETLCQLVRVILIHDSNSKKNQ